MMMMMMMMMMIMKMISKFQIRKKFRRDVIFFGVRYEHVGVILIRGWSLELNGLFHVPDYSETMDEDYYAEADFFQAKGYNQFSQSLHCQFFHSDSSLYMNPYFPTYLRNMLKLFIKVMNLLHTHFSCRQSLKFKIMHNYTFINRQGIHALPPIHNGIPHHSN